MTQQTMSSSWQPRPPNYSRIPAPSTSKHWQHDHGSMRFAMQQRPLPNMQGVRPLPKGELSVQDLAMSAKLESRSLRKAILVTDDLRSEFHFLNDDLAKVKRAADLASEARSAGAAKPDGIDGRARSSMTSETIGDGPGSDAISDLEKADTLLDEAQTIEAACNFLKEQRKQLRDALAAQQAEVKRLRQLRICRQSDRDTQVRLQEDALSKVRIRCQEALSEALEAEESVGMAQPAAVIVWGALSERVVKNAALQDALRYADCELCPEMAELRAKDVLEAIAAVRLTETANAMLWPRLHQDKTQLIPDC
eukprot:TRINITY_DN103912_c0_g1_i1.p1 TRINITY_DN103912_c0_g1~~TRINITY_DN103912_c0_g1_i1.p1  ORF type:complete len:309 (-),score=62.70 TRINITY_DN103912_c0_g1_i1:239-1165(-)